MYIYKTTIYKDTNNFPDASVKAFELAEQVDFETNYKNTAIKINHLDVAETAFEVFLTLDELKLKVVNPILWSDVKYTDSSLYTLYLLSDNPL